MGITLLWKKPRQKTIGSVIVDGYLSETHNRNSTITRYPVEGGDEITDHIQNHPISVTVSGIVSNTPLNRNLFTNLRGDFSEDRVVAAFEEFERLREAKQPISIVTGLKVYEGMAIESFTPTKNQRTGYSMEFSMTLIKITIVSSQTVEITTSQIGGDAETQSQASPQANQGTTVGESGAANTAVENNSDSILADINAQLEGLL